MHLLIGSTGIKVEREGEWHARKHGGHKRRVWRKPPIGDARVLPDLLDQIPTGVGIGSVTTDGVCDTRKCHDALGERDAHAVTPPRQNAKPWNAVTISAATRNEILRACKDLGRTLWRRWGWDHHRHRVETKMPYVKPLV